MSLFNQFSYPFVALVVGLIVLFIIRSIPRLKRMMQIGIVLAYTIIAIFIGIAFQYPDSPTQVETIADVEALLINEKPSFVMLYSNY